MKFIFEGKTYQFKSMEEANTGLMPRQQGDGAWFGPKDGFIPGPGTTYKWEKGNFYD